MEPKEPRAGFTLIELLIVVVIIAIFAAIFIPNFMAMQDRTKETKVKSVANMVQLAAEDYYLQHDGVYANNIEDLVSFFPNGILFENPFTGLVTEPSGKQAASPGQVAYFPVMQDNLCIGYIITAYGRRDTIATMFNQ